VQRSEFGKIFTVGGKEPQPNSEVLIHGYHANPSGAADKWARHKPERNPIAAGG
jgi:hypothetical protein